MHASIPFRGEFMIKKIVPAFALALVAALLGVKTFAQRGDASGKATGEIADAAKKFLATLDDAQRGKVVFDFKDQAQRKRWSNLPSPMFRRAGLRMGDLTQPQSDAAMAVLAAALSPQGYQKVREIVSADEMLKQTG